MIERNRAEILEMRIIYVPILLRFVTNRNKRSFALRGASYLSVADGLGQGSDTGVPTKAKKGSVCRNLSFYGNIYRGISGSISAV